jgi:hypothetical protein
MRAPAAEIPPQADDQRSVPSSLSLLPKGEGDALPAPAPQMQRTAAVAPANPFMRQAAKLAGD